MKYLGDGVYLLINELNQLELSTDGNLIFLEIEVFEALITEGTALFKEKLNVLPKDS